jgi:hypothetical protein
MRLLQLVPAQAGPSLPAAGASLPTAVRSVCYGAGDLRRRAGACRAVHAAAVVSACTQGDLETGAWRRAGCPGRAPASPSCTRIKLSTRSG